MCLTSIPSVLGIESSARGNIKYTEHRINAAAWEVWGFSAPAFHHRHTPRRYRRRGSRQQANITIQWVTWNFWFPSVYKCYVLYILRCTITLHLRKSCTYYNLKTLHCFKIMLKILTTIWAFRSCNLFADWGFCLKCGWLLSDWSGWGEGWDYSW